MKIKATPEQQPCPICEEKEFIRILRSGKVLGARVWSNPLFICPTFLHVNSVKTCPKCGRLYLFYYEDRNHEEVVIPAGEEAKLKTKDCDDFACGNRYTDFILDRKDLKRESTSERLLPGCGMIDCLGNLNDKDGSLFPWHWNK